jgi:ATP-binding cassette subfamily F protein 3
MLRIESLTYRIGARVLLDDASATVSPGHRVGLVGRNGTGKTTLLRLIAGQLEPDAGAISLPGRWRVGMTSQEAPAGETTLLAAVLAADAELTVLQREAETVTDPERLAEIHARLRDKDAASATARAARILAGLGFSEAAQDRPLDAYSGGWRMRVALAALLFTEPDLLLLDEPTNHLDLEASLWLEDYLSAYRGTVLLVSHDRHLLNRAVDAILHLDIGKLTLYQGGYDRFEASRRLRLELNEKLRAKQEAARAHLQSFVDRFRYKATKARQAQSRLKMLARLQPIPEHIAEDGVTFAFPLPDPLPPPLIVTENVSLGYNGHLVLRGLDLRLDGDDRVALLGANGNGKSTLIKLFAGRLVPLTGRIARSGKLRVGYFAQHQADELDLAATPLLEMSRRRRGSTETQVRAALARFGFSQQQAETPVASLSGGEKARLLFALMAAREPHVLLLDEPTNHLDVAAREALVQAINAFDGAVVIVSHDPHVIELTADRLWLVEDGRVRSYDGDLDDYRALLLRRTASPGTNAASARATASDRPASRREQRREAAQRREALAPLRRELRAAEDAVHRLEAEKASLVAALHDPALYAGDPERLVSLNKRMVEVEKALAAAEDTWITLQEAWEAASAQS